MQTTRSQLRHVAALLLVVAALARAEETAPPAPSLSAELVSLILPLVLVVAALLGAFFLLRRRFGLSAHDGPMRVTQVIAVGPRERIVLLDLDDRQLLVGVTSAQITSLATIDARVVDAAETITRAR